MYLRAVSAAARLGASLEPFGNEQLVVVLDHNEVMHFDPECAACEQGKFTQMKLDTVHLYRHCGQCMRPYHFPERVEKYASAVESLQRARFLMKEGGGGDLGAMRSIQQAHAACRRAIRIVSGDHGSSRDVERCAASIIRDGDVEVNSGPRSAYLDWAASLGTEIGEHFIELRVADPDRWRQRVEAGRGELRMRGWEAFCETVGTSSVDLARYRDAISRARLTARHVLCSVGDGEDEGDLLLWVAAVERVEHGGVLQAVVPEWAVDTATMLGAQFDPVGPVEPDERDVVSMYAELAKTRPGAATLRAARRLVRRR